MYRKHAEFQFLCSEQVSVLYEDRRRKTCDAIANLEEIGSDRATLLLEAPLEIGQPITFRAREHDLYGVVESATPHRILGWYTTVKFDASSRWHARWFMPEHCLALCASASEDVATSGGGSASRVFA